MEIILDKIKYIYGNKINAINDVSLNMSENIIYGISGKTGSGKTTLVELIDKLIVPVSGKIVIDNCTKNNFRKNIGLVFQFPEEQFFETTVEKEICFALNNFNISNKNKRIKDSLAMLGMDESYLKKNPFNLSNGEKRMIAIASILVYNPKTIILDEPTIGLDNKNKRIILNLLRRLNIRYNKKIIIISHDIDMLYQLVDNIIVMKDGSVFIEGEKDIVFNNIQLLESIDISVPNIVKFENIVLNNKKIKLGSYDDVKDLIKAVYRNV